MAGKIISSAVNQGGIIRSGLRHGLIIQQMHKDGCPKVIQSMQGFLDEDGIFLNREEAYWRAVETKQIEDDGRTPCLLSEMVW